MKAKGHRWVGLRQNEDSCSKVLECSDALLIVMPKMRSADGKITVPPYAGGCASDLGDKMFINSLDLGLVPFIQAGSQSPFGFGHLVVALICAPI
jgi:hypothetical protein